MSRRSRRAGFARIGLGVGVVSAGLLALTLAVPRGAEAGTAALAGGSHFEQPVDGKRIYETVCGACHQANGTGVPGVFPPLARSPWATGDEIRLIRVILHGLTGEIVVNGTTYSGMMPPFGSALGNPEVAAVATYIRSAWGNDAPAVTPAAVARIRAANAQRKTPWTAKELE
jgi:mono/diheme cytochrome c family protein